MKYHYDEFNNNEFESHRLALSLIDPNSKILDIGCATGYFARELLKKHCETTGVDYDKLAAKKAKKYCKRVVIKNIDEADSLPFPKKSFDYVVIMDVIEHLYHPENILKVIKTYLKKDGKVIISVPNIAHASIRWMLMQGKFEYTDTGILDRTHLHFYTKSSFEETLKKNGFEILKIAPTNGMCKVPFLYKITDRMPVVWQYRLACKVPTMFGFQFIALAKVN